MPEPVHMRGRGRRLKGLDEFETPEFVGRMARFERRRRVALAVTVVGAMTTGAALGWALF